MSESRAEIKQRAYVICHIKMYKESLHSRVSLTSPPEGEKAIIQQKQVCRSELKIQCVQMCQEHSRKYHKQELQNMMLPRCSLQGLGVRRGSWHPHHRERDPELLASWLGCT